MQTMLYFLISLQMHVSPPLKRIVLLIILCTLLAHVSLGALI